jgi:hypothetical protein
LAYGGGGWFVKLVFRGKGKKNEGHFYLSGRISNRCCAKVRKNGDFGYPGLANSYAAEQIGRKSRFKDLKFKIERTDYSAPPPILNFKYS